MNHILQRRLIFLMMLVLFSMMSFKAGADESQNPVAYMENVTNSLLNALDQNKAQLSNHRVVANIIYTKVVPHFDLGTMARSVLGRNYWNEATPAQRQEFIREFTAMIVNTYASAVEQYDGDKVKFH